MVCVKRVGCLERVHVCCFCYVLYTIIPNNVRMPFPLTPIYRIFRIRTSAKEVCSVRENEVDKVSQLPGIIDVSFYALELHAVLKVMARFSHTPREMFLVSSLLKPRTPSPPPLSSFILCCILCLSLVQHLRLHRFSLDELSWARSLRGPLVGSLAAVASMVSGGISFKVLINLVQAHLESFSG